MRELLEINKPHRKETSSLAVQKDLDGVPTLVYLPARKRPLTHSKYSFWLALVQSCISRISS